MERVPIYTGETFMNGFQTCGHNSLAKNRLKEGAFQKHQHLSSAFFAENTFATKTKASTPVVLFHQSLPEGR